LFDCKCLIIVVLAGNLVAAEPAKRPNIVLIMADDLGYGSLGCYGNSDVKTPHIDRLAAAGIRCTDYHSNGALCSPTRAALLTGRYQQRCAQVPDEDLSPVFREQRKSNPDQRWAWGLAATELTMPALLKEAGYRTALIGKWHLGYDAKFHPMNHGFDEFRGFIGGHVDDHTHIASHGTHELDWWKDRKIDNESGYATDLLTRYASEFIERNKQTPFFLYIAHGAVHNPVIGRTPGKKRSAVETYKEVIGVLDESVGAVVRALQQHDLASNTLVIFCSDNGPTPPAGFHANANLRGRKNTLFEGGHRVPMIAAWPGTIPAGATSTATLMGMDLLPTFAHVAAAKIPTGHTFDGRNILPALQGKPDAIDRDVHWLSGDAWAIRRGSWKLMGSKNIPSALYDLSGDLGETRNRIDDDPARVSALLKAHREWAKSLTR
jgi:arylsulfatase A